MIRQPIIHLVLAAFLIAAISGCGGDDGPGAPQPKPGTITIAVDPVDLAADWELAGPGDLARTGTGNRELADMPAGEYTLTWAPVAGWLLAHDDTATRTLPEGGTARFDGAYTSVNSVIRIDAEPDGIGAGWVLSLADGSTAVGTGDAMFDDLPPGSYTVNWINQTFWEAPPGATIELVAGQEHTFTGAYEAFYVGALGDSFMAGYMDLGLCRNGQAASVPALVAQAIGFDDQTEFTQPLVGLPGIGPGDGATAVYGVLHWNGTGIEPLGSTPLVDVHDLLLMVSVPQAYGNLAVPGAGAYHLATASDAGTGGANPFFDIVLRNSFFSGDRTAPQHCRQREPVLVMLGVGMEDIFLGAAQGDPMAGDLIPDAPTFAAHLETIIQDALFPGRSKLVAAGIPNMLSLPYFVPVALFEQMTGFADGYVESEVVCVLFPTIAELDGRLPGPLPSSATLTGAEVAYVSNLCAAYNGVIQAACTARGGGFVDVATIYAALAFGNVEGLTADNYLVDPDHTAFSLDMIHLNNRGQGLVANAFIEVINDVMQAELAPVDIGALTWDPTYEAR